MPKYLGAITDNKDLVTKEYVDGITPSDIGAVSTSDTIGIAHGGTGATDAAAARTALSVPTLESDGKVNVSQTSSDLAIKQASCNLSLSDCGKLVFCQNSTTDITITIPADTGSNDIPDGSEIEIWRNDSGNVNIACGSGATLYGIGISGSCKISDQCGACALKKIGTNWWIITGDVEATT